MKLDYYFWNPTLIFSKRVMNRFTISKNLNFNLDKACFKRRATAVLSWLDCGATRADDLVSDVEFNSVE